MFSVINKTYPLLAVILLAVMGYSRLSGEKIMINKFVRTPDSQSVHLMKEDESVPPLVEQQEALDKVDSPEKEKIGREISSVPIKEPLVILSPQHQTTFLHPHNVVTLKWKGEEGKIFHLIVKDARSGEVIEKRDVIGPQTEIKLPRPSKYEIELLYQELGAHLTISYKAPIAQFDPKLPFLLKEVKGEKRFMVRYSSVLSEGKGALIASPNETMKTLIGKYPLEKDGQLFRVKRQGQYCFKLLSLMKDPYILSSDPLCFRLSWENVTKKETKVATQIAPKKIEKKVAKAIPKRIVTRKIASIPVVKSAVPKKESLDQIMIYYKIEGKDTYQFKLPRRRDAEGYEVQLFRDKEGKDLYREIYVRSHRVNWRTDQDDKMYYRYRIKKKNGEYGDFSPIGTLKFPISPYDI